MLVFLVDEQIQAKVVAVVRLDPTLRFLSHCESFRLGLRAELDEKPRSAFGEVLKPGQRLSFALLILDDVAFEAFDGDRAQLIDG